MGDVVSVSPAPTVLLADADVLIDCRESDPAVLALVGQHVGRVVVLMPVLDEVHGVTATACVELGIEIVEVETERVLQAPVDTPRVAEDMSAAASLSRSRPVGEPPAQAAILPTWRSRRTPTRRTTFGPSTIWTTHRVGQTGSHRA